MADKHFGFILFIGNGTYQHNFIMESDRKNITNRVAELFVREALLQQGKYERWENATAEERASAIKVTKYRIRPVAFEIKRNTAGRWLDYSYLKRALDDSATWGGGGIPEKYWEKELTIFWEEDLTEYFEYEGSSTNIEEV